MLIGFLGLGKMGGRMVEKLLADGHDVVVWNRSYEISEQFVRQYSLSVIPAKAGIQRDGSRIKSGMTKGKVTFVKNISDFKNLSLKPHVFWAMVQYGDPTEKVLEELRKYVEKGDIIIDGANSFYKDTERRSKELSAKGIEFLGIGVSGGILAPDNGFPIMAGGSEIGYRKIKPILDSLAKPHGGHEYFGKGGAGHYIKMVHNGIEYGMMQAIGEGFGVLDKGPYTLDLEKVANLWTKGTIVAGFLLDRAKDALQKDGKLAKTAGFIEENGEAKWTIALAKKLKLPIKIIEDSLKFRVESQKMKKGLPAGRQVQNSFAAKMVAALRHEFGGHKVKEK